MRQKYYLIEWPESQKYKKCEGCIQFEGMTYLVPCELYDAKSHDSTAGEG